MLYQISRGTKAFGADVIFENIQFEIRGNEKIAVVGRNGSGKTTLLKVIDGQYDLDKGQISRQNSIEIGYLSQTALDNDFHTVEQELLSVFAPLREMERQLSELTEKMATDHSESLLSRYAQLQQDYEQKGGYQYETEMKTVFFKFGFHETDLEKTVGTFSGGQRTKIAFVKLLLAKPDILLLDEPTNHLDLATIEWLENYLRHYPKAVVLVSHDRMFLDDVCEVVYELANTSLKRYTGNYSDYVNQKKLAAEKQYSAYINQQKEIERIEGQIEKFRYKKNKAAFAQSKISYLDRLERIEAPEKEGKNFHAHFEPRMRSGSKVLTLDHFTVGYDHPLCSLSCLIKAQDRVAILGPNGKGKSTLVKTIVGTIPALGGEMMLGHQVEIGYFDQQLAQFDSANTVLEELWKSYPDLDQTTVRTALGNFLFSGDDVFKEVSVLSGGEKVRLYLAKLMLKRANFLILDEPTNHLDIEGKEALEDALMDYEGTLLFVSHDRYFIRKLATAIIEVDNNSAVYYPLNYEEYMEKRNAPAVETPVVEKKEKSKPQRNINYAKELKKLESAIDAAEKELEALRDLRYEPEYYQDGRRMQELDEQIDDKHNEIASLTRRWEEMMEESENKSAK